MFSLKGQSKPHVPARVRAYGRARLEIAQRAQTQQEWDELWRPPSQPFAFEWGAYWKHCIEYKVNDFAAEIGFFIDLLGLPVNAFNENYAMFTSPNQEFYFAVVPADKEKPTPLNALRMQFMVADIFSTVETLQQRGIQFVQEPQPVAEGSNQWVASFQTPNGICIEVWGVVVEQVDDPRNIPGEAATTEEKLKSIPSASPEKVKSNLPIRPNWMNMLDEDDEAVEDQEDEDFIDQPDEEELDSENTEEEILAKPRHAEENIINTAEDEYEDDDRNPVDRNLIDHNPVSHRQSAFEVEPRQVSKRTPANPLRTFQTADEMLNHLNQKQNEKVTAIRTSTQHDQQGEKSKQSFTPAPKKSSEKKYDSIWDTVSLEEEYVDVNEEVKDEYHYKPIPLNRDE